MDPLANTLDWRQPFDASRARPVKRALDATGLALSDVGYFDNITIRSPIYRTAPSTGSIIS